MGICVCARASALILFSLVFSQPKSKKKILRTLCSFQSAIIARERSKAKDRYTGNQ